MIYRFAADIDRQKRLPAISKKFRYDAETVAVDDEKNEVIYYLKNTDYTLKKITALLGFASVSHLWDFCIKRIGMPPNEIRSQKE